MIKPTLVFDVDGVVAQPQDNHDYVNAIPYSFAIEYINELYDRGYRIVFYTSRYMLRYAGKFDKIKSAAIIELTTWFKKHNIKYHEIRLGKPSAAIYIDDKAFRIDSSEGDIGWRKLLDKLEHADISLSM